jgi:LytS/YehU family sensor histidine kinase
MLILEAWIYFNEGKEEKELNENLRKELSEIKFEVLKNQINPHFLFNSLNVLSGLIDSDKNKAQDFIDEFSYIYRYVLETIDKPVVSLGEEIKFARSYIFLQEIRYSNSLVFNIEVSSQYLGCLMPPLSLQLILENAIKHNIVNEENPLNINVYVKNDLLIVENNIQSKISTSKSTGIGQQNLEKRYSMLTREKPKFTVGSKNYKVELPLIKSD